jgi:hypothetical protein
MPIRTKLYAAIVVTVCGLALLAGIGFWGMSRLGEHFDATRGAAEDRGLALELKYDVTDFNGWQTAYGYDNGASRPAFLRSVRGFRTDMARARKELTSPQEMRLLGRIQHAFDDFMRLDAQAYAAIQAGRTNRVRRIFLGPEIRNFQRAADGAGDLATLERRRSATENRGFVDAKRDTRRLMAIAALTAGVFVAILLVTANDLARTAERSIAASDEHDREAASP